MKPVLLFLLLGTASFNVKAAETADEARARAADENSQAAFNRAKKSAENLMSSATDSLQRYATIVGSYVGSRVSIKAGQASQLVNEARGNLAAALSYDDNKANNVTYQTAMQKAADAQKAIDEADRNFREEQKKAREAVSATFQAIGENAKADAQSVAAGAKAAAAKVNSKFSQGQFELFMSYNGLIQDYNKLAESYANVREAANIVERRLDKTVLGAYMQEKFARLLSSDTMCKAVSSCDKSGKNKSNLSPSDLKEIFPQQGNSKAGTDKTGVKATSSAGTP